MSEVPPPVVPSVENFSANERASAGERILAALVDGLIFLPIALIPCFGPIVCLVYGLTKDALPFLGGQSIGKKILKIRVVTESGDSLAGNWGTAALRQAVFYIPFFGLVELIMLFADKDTLRFGDKWAKTKVVKAK